MQYIIVRASTIKELENKVNGSISNGWKPLGGVSPIVLPNGQGSDLLQSMIKE